MDVPVSFTDKLPPLISIIINGLLTIVFFVLAGTGEPISSNGSLDRILNNLPYYALGFSAFTSFCGIFFLLWAKNWFKLLYLIPLETFLYISFEALRHFHFKWSGFFSWAVSSWMIWVPGLAVALFVFLLDKGNAVPVNQD